MQNIMQAIDQAKDCFSKILNLWKLGLICFKISLLQLHKLQNVV